MTCTQKRLLVHFDTNSVQICSLKDEKLKQIYGHEVNFEKD